MYAGTLGRKHDPSVLLHPARVVEPHGAAVVVVSEGEGADWLRAPPSGETLARVGSSAPTTSSDPHSN